MPLTPENTSVFILAAGRGKRMMPLTREIPKPLLEIAGKSLIEHRLQDLAERGFKQVIINIDYLGENIIQQLGDGQQWGLNICYSDERQTGALETAGGIRQALPLIKSDYFLCINADLWTNFNLESLLEHHQRILNSADASDCLTEEQETYTFSGIACYRTQAFAHLALGKHALRPLLNDWCEKQSLSGLIFSGDWHDIGTPARLQEINDVVEKGDCYINSENQ